MKKNKGFTLVELLAVIVIIGILSVITIVSISRLISRSKNEQLKQQKNTIAMAAENYMQANRVYLPKAIGQTTTVKVQTLRDKGYLKEEVTNADGRSCMKESIVKVYKASATKYKYTTYLYCGDEKPPEEEAVEKPTIEIKFLDEDNQEITNANKEALNDVSIARFKITYKGGTTKDIEIDGYSYAILVDTDNSGGELKEAYNSGTLNGNGNTTVVVEKYIKDYIDITTLTNVKIKATAINKDGGILDETIAFGDESASGSTKYNDKIPPVCTKIEGQANEGDWINKKNYKSVARTIKADCSDQYSEKTNSEKGSGCLRPTFTKTFPNQQVNSIEYGYITVVDNAGNRSTPISDNDITSENICDINLDSNNKCLVRINVDIVAPTIKLDAYALKKDGSLLNNNSVLASNAQKLADSNSDDKGTIKADQYLRLDGINTNIKWMNANEGNYQGGVVYKVHLHDDLHLVGWSWETNPDGINSTNNANYSKFGLNKDSVEYTEIKDNNPSINCGERDKDIEIGFRYSGMRKGVLKVYDKAGNVATYTIEANLDTTIPNPPNVSYLYTNNNSNYPAGPGNDKSPWTKIKIKNHVKVNGAIGVSGFAKFNYKYYKNNRSNFVSKVCNRNDYDCFVFEDEGTSYTQYSACNQAGTCSQYTDKNLEYPVRYDITPPTGMKLVGNNGAVTSDKWTGGPTKSVTVTAKDATDAYAGGVYYIVGNSGSITPNANNKKNTYTRSNDGVETVYFKACDKLDNCSTASKFIIKLDLRAPLDKTITTTGYKKISSDNKNSSTNPGHGTIGSNSWTGGSVVGVLVVASGASDQTPGSGFDHYIVSSSGDTSSNDKNQNYLNIYNSGLSEVKFRACDKVGNCSTGSASSTFKVKLDKEAPNTPTITTYKKTNTNNYTCTINGSPKCGSTPSNSAGILSSGTWGGGPGIEGTVSVASTVSDKNSGSISGSGLDHYVMTSGTTTKNQQFYNINKGGENTVQFKACDKVGNCSSNASFNVKLDIKAPDCSWSGESTSWAKSRTVKVNPSDSQSGPNNSTGDKWSYSSGTIVTKKLSKKVKDNVGNETTCTKTANIYIDNDPPYMYDSGTIAITDCTGGKVRKWLKFKDSGSGIYYRHIETSRGLNYTTDQGGQSGYPSNDTVDECMMAAGSFTYSYKYCDELNNCLAGSGSR